VTAGDIDHGSAKSAAMVRVTGTRIWRRTHISFGARHPCRLRFLRRNAAHFINDRCVGDG